MTDILIKIVAVLALLAALFYGEQYIERRGYDRAKAEDSAAINQLKAEAAAALASETERVRERERYAQAILDNQNLKDSDHEKTVADLSARVHKLAGPSGRLRDPHAVGCGASGGGAKSANTSAASDRPADGAETGGLLSVPLTNLLGKALREADDISNAYTSCRADSAQVRQSCR